MPVMMDVGDMSRLAENRRIEDPISLLGEKAREPLLTIKPDTFLVGGQVAQSDGDIGRDTIRLLRGPS